LKTATLAAIAAAALLAGATGEAAAVVRVRSFLEPGVVRLGEPARYRGEILFTRGELGRPQWIRPDSTGAFAWGPMLTSLSRGVGVRGVDTLRLLTTVQAFELGSVAVPGVAFVDAATPVPSPQRLPGATLRVVSILTPADSNAQLRPVRGPIAAPWWERRAVAARRARPDRRGGGPSRSCDGCGARSSVPRSRRPRRGSCTIRRPWRAPVSRSYARAICPRTARSASTRSS
jgi:hypothetical protein